MTPEAFTIQPIALAPWKPEAVTIQQSSLLASRKTAAVTLEATWKPVAVAA